MTVDLCLQIWGLDPGFREVFVACNKTKHSKDQPLRPTVQRYGAEQYYHDAHFNSTARQTRQWQDADAAYTAIVSSPETPSCKTCSGLKLMVRSPPSRRCFEPVWTGVSAQLHGVQLLHACA